MIRKKKILSLLLLCLLVSILNVSEANADDDGGYTGGDETVSDTGPGGGGGETPGDTGNPGGNPGGKPSDGNNNGNGNWSVGWDGNRKIEYQYSTSIRATTKYNILYASPYNIIKSGTWLGINIHENQTANWSVSVGQVQEVKKRYTCKKTVEDYRYVWKSVINNKGETVRIRVPVRDYHEETIAVIDAAFNDPSPCPPETTNETFEEIREKTSLPGGIKQKIVGNAHSAAKSMVGAPLSKVQITTDDLNEKNEYKTLLLYAKLDYAKDIVGEWSGKVENAYIYKPDNICMNLRTGKVSYNKDCTKEEEVQLTPYIRNNVSYWQYFSPLDMKSGSNFSLVIKNNTERQYNGNECHSIMNNYKDKYQNKIISLSGKTLKGDYCRNGSCSNLNKGSGSDWQEVSKGCYLTIIKNFNVVQKYYYEEMKNKQLMFNGYNIYYRSINIDNPFPNTPTKNSLWYDWYNSTNKNPNLKDSFKEMTYSVAVSNKLADTIRAYNVNNPYPSFDKLSLAGESEFLRSIGVNSLTNDKYYKLGGGSKTCIKDKKVSIGSDCS